MSEVFGESWFRHDYRQRLWRHRHVAEEHYKDLSAQSRAVIEAFQAGVKQFMTEHPEQVPAWAPKLEPWQVVALGRYIIWGWPEGEAGGDLLRAGIEPDPVAYHGSNEWLIAPGRTAMHAPIALIDPHLSWYGEFRFYEMRIYGGELEYSGAAIVGVPFPTLGHSRYISIAMTTGGPDTSDAYEEEIQNGKYLFRGEWRPIQSWTEKIGVKVGEKVDWKPVTIEFTHHGPIVAHKNGKAYTLAIPYADEFRLMDESWAMVTAHNLAEMKKALAMRQYMAQNIMVGTVDGDIYYVRNGRVPIRPAGCDPSKPMPGTGTMRMAGHPSFRGPGADREPAAGLHAELQYFAVGDDERFAAGAGEICRASVPVQCRSDAGASAGRDGARRIGGCQGRDDREGDGHRIFDRSVRSGLLAGAHSQGGSFGRFRAQRSWVGTAAAMQIRQARWHITSSRWRWACAGKLVEPPADLTDDDVRSALAKAEQQLHSDLPPGAVYGTLFRVGREGSARHWPVSGGTLPQAAMSTPRAVSFEKKDKIMLGHGGQTSTQIVILTKPPQSWMVIPLGESDHSDSPHFDDQAEKLFSRAIAKPTYFLRRDELEKHVTAEKDLTY